MKATTFAATVATLVSGVAFAQTATTTTTAAPAAPAATTATSLTDAAKAAKPRKLRGEILSWTAVDVPNVKNGEGQAAAANYVGLKYKTEGGHGFLVRQHFNFNQNYPAAGETNAKFNDIETRYSKDNILTFGKGGAVTGLLSVFLPTGEKARFESKQRFAVRPWLSITHPISGKWSFTEDLRYTEYVQSQNAYLDAKGNVAQNREYRLESYSTVNYDMNSAVNVDLALNHEAIYLKPGLGNAGKYLTHTLGPSVAVNYIPVKDVTLTGMVANDMNINPRESGSDRDFELLRDDEMSYHFILSVIL